MKTKPAYAFLEAQSIYLRPFLPSDEAFLATWCNDKENRIKTGYSRLITPQQIQASFTSEKPDTIWLAIVSKEDNRIIGETGLLKMFSDWGCSDCSIMIYDEQDQHRGYGQQAIHCLLTMLLVICIFTGLRLALLLSTTQPLLFMKKWALKKKEYKRKGII